jgi:hypothetical protein
MIGSLEIKKSAAAWTKAALLDSAAIINAAPPLHELIICKTALEQTAPASDGMQSKMLYFNFQQ